MNLAAAIAAATLAAGLVWLALTGHVRSRIAAAAGSFLAAPVFIFVARRLDLLPLLGVGIALVVVAMDAWRWRPRLVIPTAFAAALLAPPVGLPLLALPLIRAPTSRVALTIVLGGTVAALVPIAWGVAGLAPRLIALAFSVLLALAAGSVLGRWIPGSALREVAALVAGIAPALTLLATLWLVGLGRIPPERLVVALIGALLAAALLFLVALGAPVILATQNDLRRPALAWALQAVAATVVLSPLAGILLVYPIVAAVAIGLRVAVLPSRRAGMRDLAEARFI